MNKYLNRNLMLDARIPIHVLCTFCDKAKHPDSLYDNPQDVVLLTKRLTDIEEQLNERTEEVSGLKAERNNTKVSTFYCSSNLVPSV